MGFKGILHPFYYPEQLPLHPGLMRHGIEWAKNKSHINLVMGIDHPDLEHFMKQAKVIHFFHTTAFQGQTDFSKKIVIANHGGYIYRKFHEKWNGFMNKFIDATIIQMPDLLDLGANNEHYFSFPVQTGFLKPEYRDTTDELRIGHFPPNAYSKGTADIFNIVDEKIAPKFSDRLRYGGPTGREEAPIVFIPWYNNLDQLRWADIVIDDVAPLTPGGLGYGEFGNTSMEAAALGKIVVANSLRVHKYAEVYGELPEIQIANTAEELEEVLARLFSETPSKIHELQVKTREWVVRNHSMKAHAERLWNEVYKHLM